MPNLAVVILAAGQGTRMKSNIPKILHHAGGRPMVSHVFEAARETSNSKPVLVIAPGDTAVQELFGDQALYVQQPEQLGTGHAASMAEPLLKGKADQVLVAYADMPLIRSETLMALAVLQEASGAPLTMLTAAGDPGSSFGRVLRDGQGRVVEIVEVAEARRRPEAEEILGITELNVGVYCFDAEWLWVNLPELPRRRARNGFECYLTDLVELAVKQGAGVEAVKLDDPDEALGAGTRAELVAVNKVFQKRINAFWLENGVTIIDPDSVYIDGPGDRLITIGKDTTIWPNTYIHGKTAIGPNCVIGPNTTIRNSNIGRGSHIVNATIENCSLENDSKIKPYSFISGDTAAE